MSQQIRVDVSEIKTYNECHRKHFFNSRNRLKLHPITPNENLIFGTQFHECLHALYMGSPLETVLKWIEKEVTDPKLFRTMNIMIMGYANGPLKTDLARYKVLDVEKSFSMPLTQATDPISGEVVDVRIEGSIDLIAIDTQTNMLVGFEHKSAKNFRPPVYNIVDEQPRVYNVALYSILEEYHRQGKLLDVTEVGGIYLNTVRKLLTAFEHERYLCKYRPDDLKNFMSKVEQSARDIVEHPTAAENTPMPSMMKCGMCDFSSMCMFFGYGDVSLENIMQEFDVEFIVADHDHLDEKAERKINYENE